MLASLIRFLFYLGRVYFLIVGILVTLLICLLLSQIDRFGSSYRQELDEQERAVLVVDLHGKLQHERPSFRHRFWHSFSGKTRNTYLSELQSTIEVAQGDPRIEAIFLDIHDLSGELVDFARLRGLVGSFAAQNKTVVSFMPHGDNNSYFLASASEKIVVSPVTMLEVPGPVLQFVYFGDALVKLGVGVQVIQTGKFKSAFEPFTRSSPSSETKEMYLDLEADLRRYLVSAVAEGRKEESATVEKWFNRESFFTATQAQDSGLIDSIGYRSDALVELKDTLEVGTHISSRDYLATTSTPKPYIDSATGIGYIEAKGQIMMGGNEWDTILPSRLIAELEWMRSHEDVVAVVIRVISPGGSALASELIWREVERLSRDKPTVVSMGAQAASGGYYIATGASYIIAEPATITGSIGVLGLVPHLAWFKDKYGINFHVITQSERRAYYDHGKPMTDEDYRLIEKQLQEVYTVFLQRVATGRKISLSEVQALADGRVYTGRQALDVGLVDALGSLPSAFSKAKELAKLNAHAKYPVYRYRGDNFSFLECLRFLPDIGRCLPGPGFHLNIRHHLQQLTEYRTRVLAIWPQFFSTLKNF